MSDLIDKLTDDPTSGASGIYIKVLNHIVLGYLKGDDLADTIRRKAGDMISLNYLANRLQDVPLFRQRDVAKELQKQVRADSSAAGIQLYKALASSKNIILCHSNSGSVLRALEHRKNRIELVYQTQSKPGNDGRESAKALKNNGFKVKLIADSRISTAIKNGAVPVLGADSVTQTFFVNKVGSASIVERAIEAGITPLVVVGSEKACTEDAYGNRPGSELFERVPLDKVRLIVGSSTYRMPRDRKRLWKMLEETDKK
jgi:translation initiation factor 2B subunit (eIF-2B alpha/beta/delta family)